MKILTAIATIPCLLVMAATAEAACTYPQAPQIDPERRQRHQGRNAGRTGRRQGIRAGRAGHVPGLPRRGKDRPRLPRSMRRTPKYAQKKTALEAIDGQEAQLRARRTRSTRRALERREEGVHARSRERAAATVAASGGMRSPTPCRPHAEAEALVREHVQPLPIESRPLASLAGAVLAQSVRAERDQPPFDRVTMDGVAFASEAWRARCAPLSRGRRAGCRHRAAAVVRRGRLLRSHDGRHAAARLRLRRARGTTRRR